MLTLRDLAGLAGENVDLPAFSSIPAFTSQVGQVVARYVDPSVVERAIASAYVQQQLEIPEPYLQSAELAPGVDAQAVYRAWLRAQQAGQPWFQEGSPQAYGGYGSYAGAQYLFGMGGNAPVVARRGGVAGCNCG